MPDGTDVRSEVVDAFVFAALAEDEHKAELLTRARQISAGPVTKQERALIDQIVAASS